MEELEGWHQSSLAATNACRRGGTCLEELDACQGIPSFGSWPVGRCGWVLDGPSSAKSAPGQRLTDLVKPVNLAHQSASGYMTVGKFTSQSDRAGEAYGGLMPGL